MGWFGPSGNCGCCGCTAPPTCTLSESGGGTSGGNVNLTWTTSGADTVEIRDEDNTLISEELNGTNVLVSGGACKEYTLTATNDCGTTTCTDTDSCVDPQCNGCQLGTMPASFTVQFTNNGVLDTCACDSTTTASRCSQFSGSFTVSGGGLSCEWSGGPFGSNVFCDINRGAWELYLTIQQGDCNGNDTGNYYAVIDISYPVIDPPSCQDLHLFQKLLCPVDETVDCSTALLGTYEPCTPAWFVTGTMCDIDCVVV